MYNDKKKKYSKKTTRRRKNAPDEINTHKRFGGFNKMDIFNSGLQHLPAYIFKNLDINNDESTNAIIRKLKINVTPDLVENGIKQIIKSMNSSKKSQHVSEKFSCWQVRETYEILIPIFISEWLSILDEINTTNKAKGLGASYLRWVIRVAVRRFTNLDVMRTRFGCNPQTLEQRDVDKYNCRPNEECPSENYLINKYNLPIDDENDMIWVDKLVNAASRHNSQVDTAATYGKYFDI